MFTIFLFGTILGSFALKFSADCFNNLRQPMSRSRCDYCHHSLSFLDMIPIISQLYLKSRCRYCGQHISKRYIIFEVFVGIWLFLVAYKVQYMLFAYQIFHFLLFFILLLMVASDLNNLWVPDFLQLMLLGLVSFYYMEVIEFILSNHLISLLIVALLWLGYMLFPDKIGGADIKLFTLLLVLIPNHQAPILLLLASLSALVYALVITKDIRKPIPFVPFIVLSFYVLVFAH